MPRHWCRSALKMPTSTPFCLMRTAKAKASNQRAWRKPATPGRQRVARPRRGEPPLFGRGAAALQCWPNRDHVLRSRSFTFFRKKAGQPEIGRESRRERKRQRRLETKMAPPLFSKWRWPCGGDAPQIESVCVGVNGCLLVLRARARPGSQTEPASLIRSRPKSPTTAVRSSHGLGRECNREPERETERERETSGRHPPPENRRLSPPLHHPSRPSYHVSSSIHLHCCKCFSTATRDPLLALHAELAAPAQPNFRQPALSVYTAGSIT